MSSQTADTPWHSGTSKERYLLDSELFGPTRMTPVVQEAKAQCGNERETREEGNLIQIKEKAGGRAGVRASRGKP
jgi:hypothetical protein